MRQTDDISATWIRAATSNCGTPLATPLGVIHRVLLLLLLLPACQFVSGVAEYEDIPLEEGPVCGPSEWCALAEDGICFCSFADPTVVDDTYVSFGMDDDFEKHGDEDVFRTAITLIGAEDVAAASFSLLSFDVRSRIPADATIVGEFTTLTLAPYAVEGQPFVSLCASPVAWSESDASRASPQPNGTWPGDGLCVPGNLLGEPNPIVEGELLTLSIDETIIEQWLNEDNNGLVLAPGGAMSNATSYASSESEFPPVLVVAFRLDGQP